MAQTTLNVRMDEDVKNALEDFCQDAGINVSVAFNMFAEEVIRERRLPFDVTASRKFNDTTAAALAESEEIIKSDRRRFKNSAEMLAGLKNHADA